MSERSLDPCLRALETHPHVDARLALEFLVKFTGITKQTPRERLGPAVAEELVHLCTRARDALLSLPSAIAENEICHAALSTLAEPLALASEGVPLGARSYFPREELAELASRAEANPRLAPLSEVLARFVERHAAFEKRVGWLLAGTTPDELAGLDPQRDCDRIFHAMSSSFRVEGRVLELLAINRIAQSSSSSLFIRTTGEAVNNSVMRFYDTYTLFANFFEWGEDSKRGGATVSRMNTIHGRYYIPSAAMKYILLAAAFTWTDGAARIAHRPLLDVERRGYFHAFIKLGRAMNIAELSDDIDEMYGWYHDENRRTAQNAPLKTDTFETIVRNSLAPLASPELRAAMWTAARAGMDDTFRSALGYEAPPAREVEAVRAVFFTLGHAVAALPKGPFVRSLHNNPARPNSAPPEKLGVSARSNALPVIDPHKPNGGFPEGQKPWTGAPGVDMLPGVGGAPGNDGPSAVDVDLPEISWTEIARHRTRESLWVVLGGYVYDLTAFAALHPGGLERLLEVAGRDASDAFAAAPHSAATQVFKLNFRIGRAAGKSTEGGPSRA